MAETLFQKVWNAHTVRTLPSGQTQLFVGLHLVHEVTTPQAFDMLRQHGWRVAFPERTFATVDHIVPTSTQQRPFLDVMAEQMTAALERNCRDAGINLWAPDSEDQGIVHVIGPELGLTQPAMTIACGDSHTSTHGAPGAVAFDRAVKWWRGMASDAGAPYDDRVAFDAAAIEPTVTWGINPGQSVAVSEPIAADPHDEALAFMGFRPGARVAGTRIDVAFIGSCTNGRLSDLEEAARVVRGRRVAPHVKALIVPGSQAVRRAAEARGLHETFIDAGFEWRGAGCSMCLGMNTDRLEGRQVSASSSNRNFKGRQGSPTGRTLLMSPAMVAAAAIAGEVVDVREMLDPVPA